MPQPWTPGPLPYEMGGVIGRGGMGEVRAAHDPLLARDLAVKLVTPGDPASARRLAREAALTARLEHPGIVPVYAAGRAEDGRSWYAMRLLPGRSLAGAVAEADDAAARLRLVRHVLDAALAVAYAHGQGVIHRDLKPANVLTGAFGETIVADWGLACTLEEARVGEPGLGTPGYASPEQQAGKPVDPRADVYGLGAILAEVLTGKPVELGLRAGLREASGVAPELVAVAERAMSLEPGDRYATASAFADDLLAWFEGRRVAAHEYSTAELLSRLVRRWRVPLAVAAVGLLGVTAALAFGSREATAARELADASEARAQAAREEELRAFAAALRAQSSIAVADGRAMEAELLAVHALRRDDNADARGGLAAVYGRPRWTLASTRPGWTCNRRAIAADGTRVLCLGDTEARVIEVESGQSWLAPGAWTRGSFAGAGDRVVLADAELGLHAWTLQGAPVPLHARVSRSGGFAHSLVAGRQAVLTSRAELAVDVDAGKAELMEVCERGVPQAIAVEGDGAIVVGCSDQVLLRRRVTGAVATIRVLDSDAGVPSLLQPLPGGRLFVGTVNGTAMVLSPGGEVLARRRLGEDAVYTASLRGDRVMVGLTGGDLLAWDLAADVVTMHFRGLGIHSAWVGDDRIRVLGDRVEDRVAPGAAYPHRLRVGAGVSALAYSPDSRRLAVAAGQGLAAVYSAADGRLLVRTPPGDDVVKDVAFDATGTQLLAASAGLVQGVITVSDGRARVLSRDEAWRRAAWAPDGSIIGAPYKPEYTRIAGEQAERRDDPQGFNDLEPILGGAGLVGVGAEDSVWVSVDAGATTWRRIGQYPQAIGVAAGGARVALADNARVYAIDLDGRAVWSTTAPAGATDIAMSGDGEWVALGTMDGAVHVYRVGETGPRATMRAHRARVGAVAFSPDGNWLASGGWDEELRQWSMAALTVDPEAAVREAESAWGRDLEAVLSAGPGVEPR